MTTQKIRLPKGEWQFDDSELLGPPGGFGEVFRGAGLDGEVAVKRLKLTAGQAAHREIDISAVLIGQELGHVVPVIDAGQDAQTDQYFIVMPVCEKSLQDELNTKTKLEPQEAIEVILDVLSGLDEVCELTHRDLKPGNVLLHNGVWKIADFGIAKFVEDSTSLETLRGNLTPPYAAPEQWSGARPTKATDIYALGCIVHALIDGRPPFTGSLDEVREEHLHGTPNLIGSLSPRLSTFVGQMLRKSPVARPTLKRCINVFSNADLEEKKSADEARSELIEAVSLVSRKQAEDEAAREFAETQKLERDRLLSEASDCLREIREILFRDIASIADVASVETMNTLTLGNAILRFSGKVEQYARSGKPRLSSPSLPSNQVWDIVCWSTISIECSTIEGSHYKRSASLVYADRADDDGYRWYEASFWSLGGSSWNNAPFALDGHPPDFGLLFSSGMHSTSLAYDPLPIDGECEQEFIDRWIKLVARAAKGELRAPSHMPLRADEI